MEDSQEDNEFLFIFFLTAVWLPVVVLL